jgi:hypothetical protein
MPRKQKEEPSRSLRVGDRVMTCKSESPYEITRISPDGKQADICLIGTNLERFRVPIEGLKIVK